MRAPSEYASTFTTGCTPKPYHEEVLVVSTPTPFSLPTLPWKLTVRYGVGITAPVRSTDKRASLSSGCSTPYVPETAAQKIGSGVMPARQMKVFLLLLSPVAKS